jgi:hypothetical protein
MAAANAQPAILVSDTTIDASDQNDSEVPEGIRRSSGPSSPAAASTAPGPANSQVGGTITLTANRTVGAGIEIEEGSDLNAGISLFSNSQGGQITVQTNGANIDVSDSTIYASGTGSQVLLTTSLSTTSAAVSPQLTLNASYLGADVLKIQALGNNGVLTIGANNTISAGTQLFLYAGNGGTGGGTIVFSANVTLSSSGPTILRAGTITIDNGVTVTLGSGRTDVYANTLNLAAPIGNGGTTGTFGGNSDSQSLTVAGFNASGAPNPSAGPGATASATKVGATPASGATTPTTIATAKTNTKKAAATHLIRRATVDGRFNLAAIVAAAPAIAPDGRPLAPVAQRVKAGGVRTGATAPGKARASATAARTLHPAGAMR